MAKVTQSRSRSLNKGQGHMFNFRRPRLLDKGQGQLCYDQRLEVVLNYIRPTLCTSVPPILPPPFSKHTHT